MARALFWFSATGALVAWAAVALPHIETVDESGLLLTGALAAATALLALVAYDAIPRWAFQLLVAGASVIATAAIHYAGPESLYGSAPYLWPTVYAFWFFSRRAALGRPALIGLLYALELADRDLAHTPVAEWAVAIGTLLLVGLLVAIVRDRLSDVISNLSDAARRDPLTGLLNRRGFQEAFDVELERARRTEQALSVIVGDLDHFKEVNDEFGHAAGDDVLRAVGAALQKGKRSWDAAAGWGRGVRDPRPGYRRARRVHPRRARPRARSSILGPRGPRRHHRQLRHRQLPRPRPDRGVAAPGGRSGALRRQAPGPQPHRDLERRGARHPARAPRGREEAHVELATLLSLAEALDVRDSGSATHCQRVGRYAELIARELGLTPDSVERVRIAGSSTTWAAWACPTSCSPRRGRWTRRSGTGCARTPRSARGCCETTDFGDIGEWILAHHERPDGTGYPDGRRPEVPLEAAILGVADAYEAMTAAGLPRAAGPPGARTNCAAAPAASSTSGWSTLCCEWSEQLHRGIRYQSGRLGPVPDRGGAAPRDPLDHARPRQFHPLQASQAPG